MPYISHGDKAVEHINNMYKTQTAKRRDGNESET